MPEVPENRKIDIREVAAGYEFPPVSYQIDSAGVADYLGAVDEDDARYRDTGLVPPMAVAALALAALSEGMTMPPGAIHVSQEVEFLDTVSTADTVTSRATVARSQNRGKFHMVTVDLSAVNQGKKAVMAARTSFILPGDVGDDEPA